MSNEQQYIHDYEGEHAKNVVGARSIGNSAGFFLPYLKPGMSLLDCGCGPGSITVGLAQAVAPGQVVGVDLAESQVDAAKARAEELGVSNAKFEIGDIYGLHIPDDTFDAAFAHTVFEHLSDPIKAAKEIFRVLKPGGLVGIRSSDFMGIIINPTNEILENAWDIYSKFRQHNGGNPFVGRKLRSILRESGFTNVQWGASYDHWTTPDEVKGFMDVMLIETTGPSIQERALESEWVAPEHFERTAAAWKEWGNHPEAITAVSQCEVVGWKE